MLALAAAASRGDVVEVQRLLRERYPINRRNPRGKSAPWWALENGHTPVLKCLNKEGGIDIDAVPTLGSKLNFFMYVEAAIIL
jgi:ankyrin repeat protein